MSSFLLVLSCCIPRQGCPLDSFREWILWPMGEAQKAPVGIAIDNRGSFVALTVQCFSPGCVDGFKAFVFDCESIPSLSDITIAESKNGLFPAVAKSVDGDFLVVWSNTHCVYRRRYDRDGSALTERQSLYPDPCTPGSRQDVESIKITIDREGNHILAWNEYASDNNRPFWLIRVRKLNQVGEWLGHEFIIRPDDYPDNITHRFGGALGAVCASENGQIIVGVVSANGEPDRYFSYMVWLLDSGLRLVRGPVIATRESYLPLIGGIAGNCAGVDAEGNFVVVWQFPGKGWGDRTEDFMSQILAQRFTQAGNAMGPAIAVSGPPLRSYQFRRTPKVAMTADGRFVVAWEWTTRGLLLGQRFSSNGERIGRSFQVNVAGRAELPILTSDRHRFFGIEYFLGTDPGPQTVAARAFEFDSLEFIRGDANETDVVDLSDAISILNYLFFGDPPPMVWQAADVDDDEMINVSDPIYLISYLFLGGERPSHPYPMPGFDPTPGR